MGGRQPEKNSRVFYVLPHTASVNAMYKRLAGAWGAENVGLLHSKAISFVYQLLENDDEIPAKQVQQKAKALVELGRELWYPVRVSTLHQILRPLLGGRGWELGMAEYRDAIFIFDEIHAYNPVLVGLLIAALKILERWGGKFIFISATFPGFLRREIISALEKPLYKVRPAPREPEDRLLIARKRYNLSVHRGTIRDRYADIEKVMAEGKKVLVVCNHVATSIQVYKELKERNSSKVIMLLHSRFNPEDRVLKEDRLINGKLPAVLVSTQVVEVSLDIDFDTGFFEPAPIDALVQRFGRVNRKIKIPDKPASIVVVSEELGRYPIYDIALVEKTIEQILQMEGTVRERQLSRVVDLVYKNGYTGKSLDMFTAAKNHSILASWEKEMKAGWHESWVENLMENSRAKVEVLPECMVNEYQRRITEGLWLKARDLLVPISYSKKFMSNIDTRQDPWVIKAQYSSEIGLNYLNT